MTDRHTLVVARTHQLGAAAARRLGLPARNVVTTRRNLRGLGAPWRIVVCHPVSHDVLEELEILRPKGTTVIAEHQATSAP